MGKKAIILISAMVCFLSLQCCVVKAGEIDSTSYLSDSTSISLEIDTSDKEIGFYLFGGLGVVADGAVGSRWFDEFNIGIAQNFGIELPFSRLHIFSAEASFNSWISQLKNCSPDCCNESYLYFGNGICSQVSFSCRFRTYLFSNKAKIRASVHLGLMMFNSSCEAKGIEFGFAFHYKINQQSFISMSYNSNIAGISVSGYTCRGTVPSVLMINYSRKFSW